MAGGIQFHAPQLGHRSVGNVEDTSLDSSSEKVFHCASHSSAGLPRPDDLDAIEVGHPVAAAASDQRSAVELQMAQNGSIGVAGLERGAENLESVFTH